jgi:hypothetical protein
LELGSPATLNHKTTVLRCFGLSLALFIFTLTAFVHSAHNKADFLPASCEPASYASKDAQNDGVQQVCPACMIVKLFQTAQIVLFFLLLHIATVSDFLRSFKSKFHPVRFLANQWVRGPPELASSF